MKKKAVALLLSLALSVSMLATTNASDFMDDLDFFAEEETVVQPSGQVEIPIVLEETPVIPEEVPEVGEAETTAPEENVVPEENTDDFVGELEMSEILNGGSEEAPEATPEEEVPEIPEEEAVEEDLLVDFMEDTEALEAMEAGDTRKGWEAGTVDGVRRFRYAKGTLNADGNAEYYTAADGIVTLNDAQYYFDENGHMVSGRTTINGKDYFFMNQDHVTLNEGLAEDTAPNPVNSNLGQLQKVYWNWTGTAFEYYNAYGYFMSVQDYIAQKRKASGYNGYLKINGYYFNLRNDGTPRVGDLNIDGGKKPGLYYFYKGATPEGYVGRMAIDTWVRVKTSSGYRWRYYDNGGRTTLGIKATKLDKKIQSSVGDYLWLLDKNGFIYQEAVMKKAIDGYTYACKASGKVVTSNLVTYNGDRYYMNASGRLVDWTDSWHFISALKYRPYYFGSTPGKVVEQAGWKRIFNGSSYKWYYFNANGNANTEGWHDDYYFNEHCALLTGLRTIEDKMYIFRPSTETAHNGKVYKNCLVSYNGKKYYASADGSLVTSKWVTIDGGSYFFQKDGTMATNCWAQKDGKYGYINASGKLVNGWVIADASANKIRYINTEAAGYVKNDYRIIDGVRYYFDANGYRVSDLTSYYPTNWKNDSVLVNVHNNAYAPYYLECDKGNGVITIYADSSKKLPIRTVRTSVGNPTSRTINGTFTLTKSSRWQPLMGPSWGQYGTHVVNGIFIHSVACTYANCYNLPGYEYDRLGSPASHGCMRVCVADAKWIYDHCSGSTIRVFTGTTQSKECFKGPLGRKPLVKRYGDGDFDPTDPAIVGNKYY